MIYGKNIRLRASEREDIPRFVVWLNDPEVRAGLELFLPLSEELEENWFDEMLKRPATEQPLVIEILEGDSWRAIGNCGFNAIDWRIRSGEVGIFIGEKSCWNRGYGTGAMQILLKHGFETLNLNRIGLRVYENNQRAIRSYQKAGFIQEGILRCAQYKDGEYLDVLLMSVLRDEWERDSGFSPST